jgi:HAD superfamily hydrolase (TIGR01509 family)
MFLATIPFASMPSAIIFDLGDVLIETNARKAFWHIGPTRFIYYASAWKNPLRCHSTFYQFLNAIKAPNQPEIQAHDEHGNILPQLMCDWLKGTHAPHDILATIRSTLSEQNNFSLFRPELVMIRAIAELIFTPANFIATRSLVMPGFEFAKECKRNGHSLYILSNWDAQSYELLKNEFPQLFTLFDGIVISGHVGLIKPDPAIYQHLLTTYNLNPSDCIFIDDQAHNVHAAQKLGIHGIHHVKKKTMWQTCHNFHPARQKLKELQRN